MTDRFLNTGGGGNANVSDGSVDIYGATIGAANLNPSQPLKTNNQNQLISSYLEISDINNLQSTLNSVLTNPYIGTLSATDMRSNSFSDTTGVSQINVDATTGVDIIAPALTYTGVGGITCSKFVKSGGTNIQYLMGDGSTLTQSASSGNSNFYLYRSINGISPIPPLTGNLGYNNSDQSLATIVYIFHITRDSVDIDVWFNQVNQLNDLYIQDQNDSTNYIKYNITSTPTVVSNSHIVIPVSVISSNGTGSSSFGVSHQVLVSFFSNNLEIDTRISAVESKTAFQTGVPGIVNTTLFSGNLVGDAVGISGGTGLQVLLANGTVDNDIVHDVHNATPNNGDKIVKRDSFGNFSASIITAQLDGVANGFSAPLGGDVSGSQGTTQVDFVGGQTASNVANGTILANDATKYNTPYMIVKRDASGGFEAGTITTTKITFPNISPVIFDNHISSNLIANRYGGSSLIGTNNCSYGYYAGQALTTGEFNSYYGFTAGRDNSTGQANCAFGTQCLETNTGSLNCAFGVNSGSSGALNNTIAIGYGAIPTASNTCVIGNSSITDIKNYGTYTGSGFKIPSGTSGQILLADGTTTTISKNIKELSNSMYYNSSTNSISYKINTENWRYQSWGYYAGAIQSSVDCQTALMTNIGSTMTNIGITGVVYKGLKIRMDSAYSVVANGATCGWLGTATLNYIIPKAGFHIKIAFALDATVSVSAGNRRTMIGLYQSTTQPTLNDTATVASLTTGSMGIIAERTDTVFSFNTRGTTGSTKIATSISCDTPNNNWYWLELINEPFSSDITLILTCFNATTLATQVESTTFTCGTTTTMPISTSYIHLQQSMAQTGGITGSAVLGLGNIVIKTP